MKKLMSESYAVKMANVLPPDSNSHGTLFGGRLLQYVDDVAAISARRHCREAVVTASIDSMDFLRPIHVGEIVMLEAMVTHTGRSSMEVMVKISKEDLTRESGKELAAFSFLTFVALDENNNTVEVPKIEPDTERLQWLNDTGKERSERRLERKERSKSLSNFFASDLLE
ncbi:putative acyl-CoA thioester hydrolase YkhA [Jeotgalicoccus coquinae]|uniref:Acyl-CoA hydrolase n=1 Tax=Jeotgalicoccus coquinae TaxID=709509 RepID=A0A6V7RQY3_9STAP|nr:acyl-CoA thioesterase [Jeotgalicoccus coquinae]MBB6424096.1 acyl-CoA hydrolase [Jeotgalicoccus coquinae]GGE26573.1 putative acyl-CoA thioester hydrolase YkhA [Jeotgalicoccus coquinae]CAD2081245.1 putative acyl-CoA thioester hydrolase [Jeotgalicoccus coquinae]